MNGTVGFRDRLAGAGFRTAMAIVGRLPVGVSANIGALAASLVHSTTRIRRKQVLQNLEYAFGATHTPEERLRIAKATYRNLGMVGAECIAMWHKGPEWLDRQIVGIEGRELYEEFIASNKPFMVITAHFGNWEMLGAYFGTRFHLSVVSKPLHNASLDEIVWHRRNRFGLEKITTATRNVTREILQTVRANRTVCFLADQDARRSGIFVPFFGRPASTFAGPALLSIRLRLPLIPVYLLRLGPGRHRVLIREPLYPRDDLPTDEGVADLTLRHVKILEDVIRLAPSQYLWFHRRWKTRPKTPEDYANLPEHMAASGEDSPKPGDNSTSTPVGRQ